MKIQFLSSQGDVCLVSAVEASDWAKLLDRCASNQGDDAARFKAAAAILRADRIGAPKRINMEVEAKAIDEVIRLKATGKARSIAAAALMVARAMSGGSSVEAVADRLARGAYERRKESLRVEHLNTEKSTVVASIRVSETSE